MDDPVELGITHPNRIVMGAPREGHLAAGCHAFVDEHALAKQRTERRHGAELTVLEQRTELVLLAETDVARMHRVPQSRQIDRVRCWYNRENRLTIGITHDRLCP